MFGTIRFPAWCDRIMWTSKSNKTLLATRQLFYERAELQMSDHKPVMSLFRVNVKLFIKEKQMEIYQSLVRQLDAWENEQMPKVSSNTYLLLSFLLELIQHWTDFNVEKYGRLRPDQIWDSNAINN